MNQAEHMTGTPRHEVTITEIGGHCPVQAEGTITVWPPGAARGLRARLKVHRHRFYFRARWQHWSITVNRDTDDVHPLTKESGHALDGPQTEPRPESVWTRTEPYGDHEAAASWMDHDVARAFILESAAAFARDQGVVGAGADPANPDNPPIPGTDRPR